MMPHPAERPRKRARTLPIPLRPELIEFMDPQSLGRFSSVSATLRKDVFEAKAWEIMANARMPPRSAHEAALAAERNAAKRVKSQIMNQALQKALGPGTKRWDLLMGRRGWAPFDVDTVRDLRDLTFYVGVEEAGRVLWAGESSPGTMVSNVQEAWADIDAQVRERWADLRAHGLSALADVRAHARAGFLDVLPAWKYTLEISRILIGLVSSLE